jgi:hypothetical protein
MELQWQDVEMNLFLFFYCSNFISGSLMHSCRIGAKMLVWGEG